MSKYRKVESKIWGDPKFLALSERGQLTFLFLMTHPNQTMLGAMRTTAQGLAAERHLPLDAYMEAFNEILRQGMAKYDESACLVWLPNFLKCDGPQSPNVVRAWVKVFDLLPECALKTEVFQHARSYIEGLTEPFRKAFIEVFGEVLSQDLPKPLPNQEPEQEPEQEKKLVPDGTCRPIVRPNDFASAWNRLCGPLPAVRQFTESRRKKVKTRMIQGVTLEKFEQAIRRCVATPFLEGNNQQGWQASFDWLVENDTNIMKVLEGRYDHGGSGGAERNNGGSREDRIVAATKQAISAVGDRATGLASDSETRGAGSENSGDFCGTFDAVRTNGHHGDG